MKTKKWLNQWLELYVKEQVKPRTYTKYSQIVKTHIIPNIGNKDIDNVNREDIRILIYEQLLSKKSLSASTINSVLMICKLSLNVAEEMGIIIRNPCSNIKYLPRQEKIIDAFTKEEQRKIEEWILKTRKTKLYGIIICLYMGLRLGELIALTWSDVDFASKTLSVNKTAGDHGESYTTKTRAGKRIIPIPDKILIIFKKLKKISSSDYIIETMGKQTNMRAYRELYRRNLKKIGVRALRFHSLRHTFATRALESGMDYKTLSELMGHSDIAITINRYAHCQMERKRKALNRLVIITKL